MNKIYLEIIIANGFEKNALNILKRKKNLRLIDASNQDLVKSDNFIFFEQHKTLLKPTYVKKKIELPNKKNPHHLIYVIPPINFFQSDKELKDILY